MILVTGGLGFIGRHTARALLDLGESCVLTRFRVDREPAFLAGEIGKRAVVAPLDLNDRQAVFDLGKQYDITGIVHLAEGGLGVPSLTEDSPLTAAPLINVLQAAQEWGVTRVSVASTIGVYGGVEGNPLREDSPLAMTASQPIELMKKTSELLTSYLASRAGFEVLTLRISGVYGPLQESRSPLAVAARLIDGAVDGTPVFRPYAEDGIDWTYARDCGRAIALLQTASTLQHRVYNVGTGRVTKNREFAEAINRQLPGAHVELPEGRDPNGAGRDFFLDTGRLRADTGFEPAYDVERGVAEYVEWLKSGRTF
jgi:UDP-glucose 4-epimerase